MLHCKNPLTPPLVLNVLMRVSQIRVVWNSPCRKRLSVRREQVSQGSQVTRNRVQVENRTHLISTGDKTKYLSSDSMMQ